MGSVLCVPPPDKCGAGCRRVQRREVEELPREGPRGWSRRPEPQNGDAECSDAFASHAVSVEPEEGSTLFKTQYPPVFTAKHMSWIWLREALRERHPAALGIVLTIIVLVMLLTCGLILVVLASLGSFTSHKGTTELVGSNSTQDLARPASTNRSFNGTSTSTHTANSSIHSEPAIPTAAAKPTGSSPSVDPCHVGACRPGCAMPCQGASKFPACLCLFDIDRTLTGKQGSVKECPGNEEVPGVLDNAGDTTGTLVLSNLAQSIEGTFCSKCFRGVVSVGNAGGDGSEEREVVMQILGGEEATLGEDWSSADAVDSALVLNAVEGRLDEAVRGIVAWFNARHRVSIEDEHVHYFDDNAKNVLLFTKTGFNARQVACKKRANDAIGLCGAAAAEIVEAKGVIACQET